MTAGKAYFSSPLLRIVSAAAALLLILPSSLAQTSSLADLPDAPGLRIDSSSDSRSQQSPGAPSQPASQTTSQTQAQPSTSSASTGKQQSTAKTKKEQQQQAQEQLKQEEKQRILGFIPNFATTDIQNAAPLSPKQKFELDLHSSLDPFQFVFSALDAAEEQAENTFPEYHQGWVGYAKRFGASYADSFDGGLWGNAILPVILHEDPRYFRKGIGTFTHRALYSAFTTIWCKRDDGTWGPNYANVAGNFVAGGISNLYYPPADRGAELTVTRALTVTAEGAIGSEFVEFWPDISQRLFHKRDRVPPGTPSVPESKKPIDQPSQPASTPPHVGPQ